MRIGTLLTLLIALLVMVGCQSSGERPVVYLIQISHGPLQPAVVGQPYSLQLQATGLIDVPTWSILETADPLPTGLSLNSANGLITGTPAEGTAGAYSIRVHISDGIRQGLALIGLTVNPPPLTILTTALPAGIINNSYSATLAASGGASGTYQWSIAADTPNALPANLQLVGALGVISGNLDETAIGVYEIRVQVADGEEVTARNLVLTVNHLGVVTIATVSLPAAIIGVAYEVQLDANGGVAPLSWTIDASSQDPLPNGFSLSQSGLLTGVPQSGDIGTIEFTVRVTDGVTLSLRSLRLTIVPVPLAILTASLPNALEGAEYSHLLSAEGGTGNFAWSLAGGSQLLPTGLSLTEAGSIFGAPAFDTAGSRSVTIQLSDGVTILTRALTFTVAASSGQTLLDGLAEAGGGIAGSAAASNGPIFVRAIDATSGQPLAGIGAIRSSAGASVATSAITDVNGEAVLIASGQPQSVSLVDPVTGHVQSFFGSPQAPVRQAIVAAFPRGPRFDVTLTGIPAGHDLVVKLNGRTIAEVDNAGGTEIVPVRWSSADEMLVGAGEPWLVVAHLFTDDSPGTVDQTTLATAGYLVDVSGSTVDTAVNVSLDLTSGIGSNLGSISSGLVQVVTLQSTVTRPALPSDMVALSRITKNLTNSYGDWDYGRLVLEPLDPVLLLPPVGPVYQADIMVPNFSTIPGANINSTAQVVELFVGGIFDLGAMVFNPEDFPSLVSRVVAAGLPSSDFLDLSTSLPSLATATVFTNYTVDAVSGSPLLEVHGRLMAEADPGVWIRSQTSRIGGGNLHFNWLVGDLASPLTFGTPYLELGRSGSSGSVFQNGATVTRSIQGFGFSLSGDGNTGSEANPAQIDVAVSQSALSASLSSPASGGNFSLSSSEFGWLGTGLEGKPGFYLLSLTIPTTTPGVDREWTIYVPSGATQTAGFDSYLFRLPLLPATAPFAAGRIEAGSPAFGASVEFVDLTGTGIDPLQARSNSVATVTDPRNHRMLSPQALATAADPVGVLEFAPLAALTPVP